jgi:Asp-tRNAAsn/Glu-tRNAGln amidotransferase A subunit and related amidases
MAQESAERWRTGEMLSLFDGIPVAIKDEYIVVCLFYLYEYFF